MEDADSAGLGTYAHVAGRVIHAVFDISVFQVIHQLLHRHRRAVVLGFLRGRSQMGDDDAALLSGRHGIREVGYVPAHLSALNGADHGRLIHQKISGKVQKDHAVLHLFQSGLSDHSLRAVQKGNVDGDDIAFLIDLVHIDHVLHVPAEVPGRVHGHVRIIAVDLHAQMLRRVGHLHADGSQADDAELLSLHLGSREILFDLLGFLSHLGIGAVFLHPVDAVHDVPGGQQHGGDHDLLYAVGVCARRVEDHDSLFRAFVQGDVVRARSGPGHRQKFLRQLHFMHGSAADQDALRLRRILYRLISFRKPFKSHTGDGIQAIIMKHVICSPFQIFS